MFVGVYRSSLTNNSKKLNPYCGMLIHKWNIYKATTPPKLMAHCGRRGGKNVRARGSDDHRNSGS